MPVYFLIFSFIIAPFTEEILFRGFLVPRLGIILSAIIFAVPHFISYLSISEFVAAFLFGLAAGYAYKKTGSLYVSILAHMLVNFLAILSIFLI
ncbi:MAG: CPBP family intramembrane glutamic endopeptidase [Candidatus Micrarchaeia archaeon]